MDIKTFVINLSRRKDRMNKIDTTMKYLGINYCRFEATDGATASIRNLWLAALANGSRISSPGAYACLLSHLAVIRKAKQHKYSRILILEDDALFHKNFESRVSVLEKVPESAEIIYLGASHYKGFRDKVQTPYYRAQNAGGAFAYIIRDTLYDDLIAVYEKMACDVDVALIEIQKKHECYILTENLIIADLSDSDIRTEQLYGHVFGWNMDNYC